MDYERVTARLDELSPSLVRFVTGSRFLPSSDIALHTEIPVERVREIRRWAVRPTVDEEERLAEFFTISLEEMRAVWGLVRESSLIKQGAVLRPSRPRSP
jgi:hypothetical protein